MQTQGCDSRTRGNHARGLKNSLHAVFARYLRGNHVRYIYGTVLKYTVNTGELVFFLVVGGRRVFKFRVWCACLSFYSLFLSSRPFLPPCACAFSCSVHRHGPWLCAYRQVRNVTAIARGWATLLLDRLRDFVVVPSSAGGNSSFELNSQSMEERATLGRYHHFHGHSGMCA